MSGIISPVISSVVRRMAVVLAVALAASAQMIIAGAVPQASACSDTDNSNHCYAVARNLNNNTNHGVYGELNVHCLYQPNNGNQARIVLWDQDSWYPLPSNWVEAGILSGVDYHGTYRNKNWYWADKRPGFSYSEHDTSVTASTDTNYPTEIFFVGNGTWDVWGENSYLHFGTSTNNSANLIQAVGGTEYYGGSASGIRNIGDVYNLQRKSSSDTWYSWDANGQDYDLGPGNYINGHYVSGSHEYWNGPC